MEKSISSHQYEVFLTELRAVRREMGLTQVDLATRLGETQSFVSKFERGERRIDVAELKIICRAIGIELGPFIRRFERALEK